MTGENTDYTPSSFLREVSGRSVLFAMIGFFALIFLVNGIFIYKAVATFDGLESDNAYQKGRTYNHMLEAMEAQKALGWKAEISTDGRAGEGAHIAVVFTDHAGAPLGKLKVRGGFWRPVVSGMDQSAEMHETAPGRYEADFRLAAGGNWIARISAQGANGEKFVQEKRVIIRD
jgi:nitrogen fixation protein FixH